MKNQTPKTIRATRRVSSGAELSSAGIFGNSLAKDYAIIRARHSVSAAPGYSEWLNERLHKTQHGGGEGQRGSATAKTDELFFKPCLPSHPGDCAPHSDIVDDACGVHDKFDLEIAAPESFGSQCAPAPKARQQRARMEATRNG